MMRTVCIGVPKKRIKEIQKKIYCGNVIYKGDGGMDFHMGRDVKKTEETK